MGNKLKRTGIFTSLSRAFAINTVNYITRIRGKRFVESEGKYYIEKGVNRWELLQ